RLVRRFIETVATEGGVRSVEWRCSPFHSTTPLHPLIDGLEHELGIDIRSSSPSEGAGRGETFLTANGLGDEESLDPRDISSQFAQIASSSQAAVDQSVAETPTVRRSRMFRLLCDVVAALARKNPTVIVIEDLQWADASTTELVRYLAEQCGRLPL